MLAMSGTPQAVVSAMAAAGLGVAAFLTVYVATVLLLGTVIDSSSIMLVVLPLMLPVAEQLGLNLIWFGVVTVVAVEIGLLTPPFGIAAFVVKSTLGSSVDITLSGIFRGTAPFTLTMIAVLVLLILFPQLSLMLLNR
jgi:TRAP-type mannitol/chloroaromatic compound transport system permease large subunit